MKKEKSIQDEIEEYFIISNLKSHCCDELSEESIKYGISTIEQWEKQFKNRLFSLLEKKEKVLLNLAKLRKKWPLCCDALEEVLLSVKSKLKNFH